MAEENIFGFRSPHETLARKPGVRRILTIGDSFTWGEKVGATDSTWPARLEADLARLGVEPPTEVINIGRRGWSTAEEARTMDRVGCQFQHDRLLVQYYANDAELPEFVPRAVVDRDRGRRPGADWELLRSSALVWVLRREFTSALNRLRHNQQLFASYEDGSPGWIAMTTSLQRIADSARARGVPVTLLLFPIFTSGKWTPATYRFRHLYLKVAGTAKAMGLEVLDLTDAYAAEGGDWWSTAGDGPRPKPWRRETPHTS